jgi:hypothetical protein
VVLDEPVEGEAVVSVELEDDGEAVVPVELEGDVVEVPAALPLIEPLWPLCAAEPAAPAGCVQGWLLVLPVALPVVPPEAEPV